MKRKRQVSMAAAVPGGPCDFRWRLACPACGSRRCWMMDVRASSETYGDMRRGSAITVRCANGHQWFLEIAQRLCGVCIRSLPAEITGDDCGAIACDGIQGDRRVVLRDDERIVIELRKDTD